MSKQTKECVCGELKTGEKWRGWGIKREGPGRKGISPVEIPAKFAMCLHFYWLISIARYAYS